MKKQVISLGLLLSCVATEQTFCASSANGVGLHGVTYTETAKKRTPVSSIVDQPKSDPVKMPSLHTSTNTRKIGFASEPYQRQSSNVYTKWEEPNPNLPQTGTIGVILASYSKAQERRILSDLTNVGPYVNGILGTEGPDGQIIDFPMEHEFKAIKHPESLSLAVALTNHAQHSKNFLAVIPALAQLKEKQQQIKNDVYHGKTKQKEKLYFEKVHKTLPPVACLNPVESLGMAVKATENQGVFPPQPKTTVWDVPIRPEHKDLSLRDAIKNILLSNNDDPMKAIGALHLEMLRSEMEKTLDPSRQLTHIRLYPVSYQSQINNGITALTSAQSLTDKEREDLATLRAMLDIQRLRDLYLASPTDVAAFTTAFFAEQKARYAQMVGKLVNQTTNKEDSHSLVLMLKKYSRRLDQVTVDETNARTARQTPSTITTSSPEESGNESETPAAS